MDSMKKGLSKRVKVLREGIGLSQRELAEKMGLPRSTISLIETGDRKVSAEELLKLSNIFNVTPNNLLDLEKETKVILQEVKKKGNPKRKPKTRINVPQKNLEKFKEILLYILNKVGSKVNVGETVIYKLLYFIDFDFYEKYEEQLIGATYIRNKYGPTPIEFSKIVEKMIEDKDIEKVESKYFSYPQTKYLPRKKADLSKMRAHEIEVIDDVLNRLSDMNAAQISDYSHQDVPWLTTDEEGQIEYESVFYRTPPYSVREYSEDR